MGEHNRMYPIPHSKFHEQAGHVGLTVVSPMMSLLAISALDIPVATSRKISISRGVSSSTRLAGPFYFGELLDEPAGDGRGEESITSGDHPHATG